MDAIRLLIGGVLLYFGAEVLVGSASRLAASLRVSQLVIGLTVVAYGTSTPEIIVSLQAAHAGHGDVAIGNIVGSNIANLGLILGASSLVRPARVDGVLRRRELPVLLVSTLALPLVLLDGVVAPWEAAALVGAAILYTGWMIRTSRSPEARTEAVRDAAQMLAATSGVPTPTSRGRQGALAILGLGIVLVGGHLFVEGGTVIARAAGMSERTLGLTIIAVGTSLPELTTALVAAFRGNSDIAVGNAIGSNIFNTLLCLGLSGLVGDLRCSPADFSRDLGALVVLTLVSVVFLRTERTLRRWEAATLLVSYAGFLAFAVLR